MTFFFMTEYSVVYISHFPYPSVNGRLGWLCNLATMNSAYGKHELQCLYCLLPLIFLGT